MAAYTMAFFDTYDKDRALKRAFIKKSSKDTTACSTAVEACSKGLLALSVFTTSVILRPKFVVEAFGCRLKSGDRVPEHDQKVEWSRYQNHDGLHVDAER